MSHTPGPWRYRPLRDENGDEDGGVLFGENAVVADYLHLDNPDDACLIAAAPEQNEALKLARKFIANGIELGYITMPADDDPASKTLDIIDAALAKAEEKEAGA